FRINCVLRTFGLYTSSLLNAACKKSMNLLKKGLLVWGKLRQLPKGEYRDGLHIADMDKRTVGENHALWSDKLDDALCAFRTSFKTPIACTPYELVYRKSCHLPIELEHKAYWALKHANFDLKTAGDHRPFTITKVFPYGTIKLSQPDSPNFKVNGHRVKHYFGEDLPPKVVKDLHTFSKDE
ncbi:reverse transcriptase domain-containing protein, partial [Tanacetum coccineum]